MSLSWLDRRFRLTRIGLARDRLSLERGGAARVDLAFPPPTGVAWAPALAALAGLLGGEHAESITRRVRLIIANDFVRFVLVPWSEQILDQQERQQLARALLAERYGEREWRIAIEPPRFGKPGLAAAIDEELAAQATQLVHARGQRVVALVPALADTLNRHGRRIDFAGSGWVVEANGGRLTSLAFSRHRWCQVGSGRFGGDESLDQLIKRDLMRSPELAGARSYLDGAASPLGPWPIVRLSP